MINNIETFVKNFFKDRDASHDYWHCVRVRTLSLNIAKKEGITDKEKLEDIEIAGLLHDVEDHKYSKVSKKEKTIREILEGEKLEGERIKRILKMVDSCSFTKEMSGKLDELTLEQMIVQDADRLDAIGAIGIARCFIYTGYKKTDLKEAIDHFHKKLFKLKGLMKTKTGRQMAESRDKYMQDFLKKFLDEWNGRE